MTTTVLATLSLPTACQATNPNSRNHSSLLPISISDSVACPATPPRPSNHSHPTPHAPIKPQSELSGLHGDSGCRWKSPFSGSQKRGEVDPEIRTVC